MRGIIVGFFNIFIAQTHAKEFLADKWVHNADDFSDKMVDKLIDTLLDRAFKVLTFRKPAHLVMPPRAAVFAPPSSLIPPLHPHSIVGHSTWSWGGHPLHKAATQRQHIQARGWNPFASDEDVITCARVQLALFGQVRQVQRNLDDISAKADTDSLDGLHQVLVDVALSLLRKPEIFAYGFVETSNTKSLDDAEENFGKWSLEERSKFDEETSSNVDGKSQTRGKSEKGDPNAEKSKFILISILLAYDGKLSLPKMSSLSEAKEVLTLLGNTQADGVNAVEVIWNPQEEGDTLTADDLLMNYPQLLPL